MILASSENLTNLYKKMPLTMAAFTVGAFAMIGVPLELLRFEYGPTSPVWSLAMVMPLDVLVEGLSV